MLGAPLAVVGGLGFVGGALTPPTGWITNGPANDPQMKDGGVLGLSSNPDACPFGPWSTAVL